MSLADPEVYGIPMVLMLGWSGEPFVTDEPQHIKKGRIASSCVDLGRPKESLNHNKFELIKRHQVIK